MAVAKPASTAARDTRPGRVRSNCVTIIPPCEKPMTISGTSALMCSSSHAQIAAVAASKSPEGGFRGVVIGNHANPPWSSPIGARSDTHGLSAPSHETIPGRSRSFDPYPCNNTISGFDPEAVPMFPESTHVVTAVVMRPFSRVEGANREYVPTWPKET